MDPTQLADTLLAQAAETVAARARRPESTYRLQFHAGFTFAMPSPSCRTYASWESPIAMPRRT